MPSTVLAINSGAEVRQADCIEYDEAVTRLETLASRTNWEIGEIANKVRPKYGENTIKQLANDSGVEESTLRRCRDVFRAWPESANRFANATWTLHMIFAAQPDRVELIRERKWTKNDAAKLVKDRRDTPQYNLSTNLEDNNSTVSKISGIKAKYKTGEAMLASPDLCTYSLTDKRKFANSIRDAGEALMWLYNSMKPYFEEV